MTVLAVSPQLRLDGLVVATNAHGLNTIDGLDVVSRRRSNDRVVAYSPGEVETWDDYPEGKTRRFDIWITPYDVDGNVTYTNGPLAHLRENIDDLTEILAKRGSWIDVELDVTQPTGAVETRSGRAKMIGGTEISGTRLRRARVDLYFPFPYWNVLPVVAVNGGVAFTGSQIFTVAGGAPAHDLEFTAAGNTVIEHVQTGDTLTVTGATGPVVINCRSKTVTDAGLPAPGVLVPSHDRWMRFLPGSNEIVVTGAATSLAYFAARE